MNLREFLESLPEVDRIDTQGDYEIRVEVPNADVIAVEFDIAEVELDHYNNKIIIKLIPF